MPWTDFTMFISQRRVRHAATEPSADVYLFMKAAHGTDVRIVTLSSWDSQRCFIAARRCAERNP